MTNNADPIRVLVIDDEKEANALITASKIIETNNDESLINAYSEVVEKVKAVLKTSQKEKLEILEERIFTWNPYKKEDIQFRSKT